MSPNLRMLARVAGKVEPLLDRLVFVGGAVAELYFSDPASDRVRPTTDTDAICEVGSYTDYHRLGERLRSCSFTQTLESADPPYRWRSGDDVLDIMPRDAEVLGFSNPWYGAALERTQAVELDDGLEIAIPEPPIYLATKLAAHEDRGRDDPLTSADLEDVIALITNRPQLLSEVEGSELALKNWIADRVTRLIPSDEARDVVGAFVPEARQVPGLQGKVMERLETLREIGSH